MNNNQLQRVKLKANMLSKQQQWKLEKELKRINPEILALIESTAMKSVVCTMHALYAISLNSTNGIGTKRMNEIIERVMNQFVCIRDGYLDAKDVTEWCNEKGINYLRNEV